MKNIILIISVLFISACASVPAVKSVAGTYELKKDGDTLRAVFLENGASQAYKNGEKDGEGKWSVVDGEIHIVIYRW